MSEPPKKPDLPEKPEPRTAGAPTTREDIFNNPLPVHPDDEKPGNDDPDEEKITFMEALKEKVNKARRKSVDLLGLGDKKKDEKKDESKDGASKTA